MQDIIKRYIERYKKERRFRRWSNSVFLVMALVVVAGVFWQMKMPGLSMSGENICGREEHQHSSECYESVLVCGQEESEDQIIPGHIHTEDCYALQEYFVCQEEEHIHGEGCYDDEGNLVCMMQEHFHTEACYMEEMELICGQEESEDQIIPGHVHTEQCYEDRLVCGKEEHVHTSDCFQEIPEQDEESFTVDDGEIQDTPYVNEQDPLSSATANKLGGGPGTENEATYQRNSILMADGTGTDFTQYIDNVTVSKIQDGVWVPAKDFIDGDSIKVDITYTLAQGVVHEGNRTIYYDLPPGIRLNQSTSGNVTRGSDSTEIVGTYTISEEGLIEITFNESFADGEAFEGTISFQGVIAADEIDGEGEIDFGTDGSTITVKPDESKWDVGIRKTGDFNLETSLLDYEITVSTQYGTGHEVTVTDTFTSTGTKEVKYERDSFQVVKNIPGEEPELIDIGDKIVFHEEGGLESFEIIGLPKLNPGESYTITYSCTEEQVTPGNGYCEVNNTATATSGKKSDESSIRVNFKAVIDKFGEYDAQSGRIKWRIVINEVRRDIGGWTFKDDLPVVDGEPLEIVGDVILTDSRGNQQTITLPYTFPEGTRDTYTITYETEAPVAGPGELVKVVNKGIIEGYESEREVHIVGQEYGMEKKADSTDGPGTDGIISWTADVEVPAKDLVLTQLTYVDTICDLVNSQGEEIENSHYTTPKLLENLVVSVTLDQRTLELGTDYKICDAEGQKIEDFESERHLKGFQIEFLEAAKEKVQGSTIHISYQTQVDLELLKNDKYTAENRGAIPDHNGSAKVEWENRGKIDKQVSSTGLPDDENDRDTSSFTNDKLIIDYDESGGIIHYRLLLTPDKNDYEITVTDTLPKGATLVEDSVRLVGHQGDEWYVTGEEVGYPASEHIHVQSQQNEDGTTTVTFTIDEGYQKLGCETLAVYYDVSVAEDESWENSGQSTNYYNNIASWDDEYDMTETEVEREISYLEKTGEQIYEQNENGEQILSNIIRYYIVVNPRGEDMDPGSSYLELTDTLTVKENIRAEFQPESVGLYHYDEKAADNHYCGNEISTEQYPFTYDSDEHKIVFTLPDSTPCVLVYDYVIDRGTVAGDIQISNEARLNGNASGSTQDDVIFEEVSSEAAANKATMTLYKVDSTNYGKLLPGARFRLQRYEKSDSGGYEWQTTSVTAEGEDGMFVVGETGKVVLSFLSEESRYNTLYRATEVAAPEGYQETEHIYYFVWMEEGKDEKETIDAMREAGALEPGVSEEDITFVGYSQSGNVYIPNDPTELTVKKQWLYDSGAPMEDMDIPESIEVELYQHKGKEEKLLETVELSRENGWKYTWESLPKQSEDGTKYLYTVKEKNSSGYTVTYSPNNSSGVQTGEIVITNIKEYIYTLPKTGSSAGMWMAVSGTALVTAAVLYNSVRLRRSQKKKI